MSEKLLDNAILLKNKLDELNDAKTVSPDSLFALEDIIQVCDRMVECLDNDSEELNYYTTQRNRYKEIIDPYKGLNDEITACQIHIESLRRQNKIGNLAKNVNEIVAMSDFINYTITYSEDTVNNINEQLLNGYMYMEISEGQLTGVYNRKKRKYRFIRGVIFGILILFFFIYLLSKIF